MAIPKYFEMYNAFLKSLEDGNSHTMKEVKGFVSVLYKLTDEDLTEVLPSGKERVFDNRIGWTRTYLKKAGLIISPAKAVFVLTEEGKKILASDVTIDNDVLMKYPSFVAFKNGTVEDHNEEGAVLPRKVEPNDESKETPQEIMERVQRELNNMLSMDLLNDVLAMDPYKFENLVVDLLVKMGYGKLQYNTGVTKKSGDEGIDGVVTADKLGFDAIYIQAKRYNKDNPIGRPDIQKFVGALAGQGAQKGIFITTSKFSKEAWDFVNKSLAYNIVLIDGKRLCDLMIEFELGVSVETVYTIKRIDTDYFDEQ